MEEKMYPQFLAGMTEQTLLDKIQLIVATQGKGAFVYRAAGEVQGCAYNLRETPRGKSRCLIGEFLHENGVDDTELNDLNGQLIEEIFSRYGGNSKLAAFALIIQYAQDAGTSWYSAIQQGHQALRWAATQN